MTLNHDQLLVLDDTVEIAELIADLAVRAGYRSRAVTDVEAFSSALETLRPAVVVLDLQMPGADGIDVLRQLAADACEARIIIVSGMDQRTIESAKRYAMSKGLNVIATLAKPFAPEAMVETLKGARSLTGRLRAEDLALAIDDGALGLQFQPVVRRLGRRSFHAESVEALPRWRHAEFGLLTPAQFIPLIASDRSELMRALADLVLQQGMRQLNVWQSQGLHLGLRVNIPGGLIGDTDFPNRLERLLLELDTDPALLTLELSDVASLCQTADGLEILTRLRLKGINLSLDDFGADDAALKPLYSLPINEVKIDRSVIADLDNHASVATVLESLLGLFRSLDIACCAEGVETSEQLSVLDRLHCPLLQGYYIGSPVPAAEIPKAVAQWTADSRAAVQVS